MYNYNIVLLTQLFVCACVDAYWTPFVEEMAQEIGNSPTIIYVDSKKSALDLTTSFNQHSEIKAAAYTEDTSKSDKKAVLSNWADDEISLVVATSAFGLGVNKPNVRYVYHVGVPPRVEAWVQEAGRGGRDGNQCTGSYCINCDLILIAEHPFICSNRIVRW